MIDLHTHSTASDGTLSPAEVAELAAQAGCTAFALTDHDGVGGVGAAGHRAAELGVRFIPGCEISCPHSGTLHLLVYWISDGEGPLQDALVSLQEVRVARNRAMATRLAELGIPVTYDELVEEAGGMGVGRPHAAAVLVRKGVVASVQEAFDVWLAKGRPGYVEKTRLAVAEALRLARLSGGVAVLAHPLSLNLSLTELSSTVGELASLGLAGIEAVYGRYSAEERSALVRLAGEHGLVASGGSDFHGAYKPDLAVGVGRGDLEVPEKALEDLEARRP